MKKLAQEPIANYMDALARPAPVPGGGSSGALVGALGAALLEMSMGYSSFSRNELKTIRKIRIELTRLIDEDARAYKKVIQSRRENFRRKQEALIRATKVPQEICRCCQRSIRLAKRWGKKIKPALKSDWVAGEFFLKTAFKAVSLNVGQNLKELNRIRRTTDHGRRMTVFQ